MSPEKIVTLKLSAIFVAATTAFPPFIYGSLFGVRNFQGFGFLFGDQDGASVDVITLIAEWLFIAIIAAIFYKLDSDAPIPDWILRNMTKRD